LHLHLHLRLTRPSPLPTLTNKIPHHITRLIPKFPIRHEDMATAQPLLPALTPGFSIDKHLVTAQW